MNERCTNPGHWIWHTEFPHRFDPDEGPYLAVRSGTLDAQVQIIEAMIEEGMSAEQMVALWKLDGQFPEEVVAIIGAAMAYWVQRAREEDV